jgi:hypothetical protein
MNRSRLPCVSGSLLHHQKIGQDSQEDESASKKNLPSIEESESFR